MLMHHPNVQRRGVIGIADLDHLAVFLDHAFFRLVKAEQNAHQSGLSRAVLAQQRMNLSGPQLQGDVVVGLDPGENLGDVQHLDHIFRHTFTSSLFVSYMLLL